MKKEIRFDQFVLADNKYDVRRDNVKIGKTNYKMLFQREITGDTDNERNVLCVNCFQFIPKDSSNNYMLTLGCDNKFGNYSFTFTKNKYSTLIDMDNIFGSQEDLPNIKEFFEDHYGSSGVMISEEKEVKFEDISDILYALFDYCYGYLVKNGFHVI